MFSLELPVIRVWIDLEVDEPKKLPRYLFSPLRGVIGAHLKRISCVARRYSQCLECPLNQHCAYGYIFETPRPKEADRLRLYPYLPHPFTITPPYPTTQKTTITLGLTLVGRAIQYFPHFILTLEAAGTKGLDKQRVPFKIRSIRDHQDQQLLYQEGKLKPPTLISSFPSENKEQLKLSFKTPVCLRFEGKIVRAKQFAFHILIRNLLRRVSALSYFHAGKELSLDFRGLIEKAQHVRTVERNLKLVEIMRYSARTKQKMPLRGLVGEVSFEGELEPFTALLKIGELVHVGKNTSFGFGYYAVMENKIRHRG